MVLLFRSPDVQFYFLLLRLEFVAIVFNILEGNGKGDVEISFYGKIDLFKIFCLRLQFLLSCIRPVEPKTPSKGKLFGKI